MPCCNSKRFAWAKWKLPCVTIVLSFLCNIENSMLVMGEWPYMTTIDPYATSAFYGGATSANKAANVIFTFLFAIWSQKISGTRIPMIVGRCVTLVSCVMYIFVEFIPTGRRWWMLVCYLLFGVGFGTGPLLRSYMVHVTTEDDRATAFALSNGAMMLALMVGPLAQIAFAAVPYPGWIIIPPNIKINIYTAPIWTAVITNIVALVVSTIFLVDVAKKETAGKESSPFTFSLSAIKDQLSYIRSLNIPWILVVVVLVVRMFSDLFINTMAVIAAPMLMTMYALTGQDLILLLAIAQVIVGLLASGLAVSFFVFDLGKRVSCRLLFLLSNLVMVAGYLITYPFSFSSNPMQPFNETTRAGCDPEQYSWCDTQLAVNIIPLIIILIIASSFCVLFAGLSIDTIYSKMLGDIDQSVMQSVFAVVVSVMGVVTPIYATGVFTAIGYNYIDIINGSLYIISTLLWLAAWRWLKPYN